MILKTVVVVVMKMKPADGLWQGAFAAYEGGYGICKWSGVCSRVVIMVVVAAKVVVVEGFVHVVHPLVNI
jgi:hypothetical protein